MERKRRISAPFLRAGLNNYQQSKTAVQPENTIIAFIQAEIADNIFSPIIFKHYFYYFIFYDISF